MIEPIPWPRSVKLARIGAPVIVFGLLVFPWCVPTTTTFTVAPSRQVDLVLVVDDSGSMEAEQAGLAAHLGTLLAGLRSDVGVRVAVTTTTVTPARPLRFLMPDDPALAREVQVGTDGDTNEQGLQVMLQTLEQASEVGPDATFRPGAALAFVVIGNEDDHSNMAVSTFVDAVAALRAARQTPVVLSVVTVPDASRHHRAARALGGRVLDLDGDWGQATTAIASDLSTMSARFTLPSPAFGPVTVHVDGNRVEDGHARMAADRRTVVLDHPLHEGATVSVTALLGPLQ